MADETKFELNQSWDSEGNLIYEELVEVPVAPEDNETLIGIIQSLSPEQIAKLKEVLDVI